MIAAERAWLFGGAVGRAYGDNSAALHRHIRDTRPQQTTRWLIDRDSPDRPLAERQGPILLRDTVEAHIYAMLAEVIVISHGVHDVPGLTSSRCRALKVRLGHGLTALKRTRPRLGHDNRSANAIFDLVPVASEFEAAHKREWDVPAQRIVVTGLARFDTLRARDREIASELGRILYMPTWRERAGATALVEGVADLLGAPALAALLEVHDAHIDVFTHINIGPSARAQLAALESKRVRFIAGDDPQPSLARASLLITDWSSVAWDMLYIDKPVLFYQFDAATFGRDGYLPPAELPGALARDASAAIAEIARHLDGGSADSTAIAVRRAWQGRAFRFRDDRNCERIVAAIDQRLGE